MKLAAFSVHRPITTLMAVLSVIVIGWISLSYIPLEYMPEFSSHRLSIYISYPSSAPKEVEDLISRPVEEAMGTVKGLDEISTSSSTSSSNVRLRFKDSVNMDLAAMEVRDRIDRVRDELPEDVTRIYLRRWQTTDLPVVEMSLSSAYGKAALQEVVDGIVMRRLQRLEGVANVEVRGMEERELIAELDLARMKAHGVEPYNIRAALRRNNLNLSAGYITDGGKRYVVRCIGEFQKPEDLERLPLTWGKVRLGDVAEVRYEFPDRRSYQILDGHEAVALRVYKASSANLVGVSQRVQKELRLLEAEPSFAGVKAYVYRDRAEDVLKVLANVKNAGLTGGVLVVVILFFFLRSVRSTLIVSTAIPLSVLFAFGLMFLGIRLLDSDITINIITLTGLMMSLGMLVDPAIVVLENIFRVREDRGLPIREAAVAGTSQVGTAVLAATATTMCVFVPMIFFTEGRMRIFGKPFAITICLVLLASLLVALTLVPLVASRLLVGKTVRTSWLIRQLTRLYGGVISLTLRFRLSTILVAMLVAGFSFYVYFNLGKARHFGRGARRVRIRVDTPKTFEIEDTRAVLDRIVQMLTPKKRELEIDVLSCHVQRDGGMLEAFLVSEDQARRSTEEVKEAIKDMLPSIAGVRYRAGRHWGMGGEQMGVSLELQGPRSDVLARYAATVRDRLDALPLVDDVDTSIESGNEEIQASIDRKRAQGYGLSPLRIAQGVSAALSARAASTFKTQDREVDIKVQLREEDRVDLEQLKNLEFQGGDLQEVTFDQVASFQKRRGPQRLRRQNRQSVVSVTANTDRRRGYMARAAIQRSMDEFGMPPGYRWYFAQSRWERREDRDSNFGLILAAALVYMIMASLFESFVHPFVIMFSIPFAFTGVAIGFHLTGNTIDHMTAIGVLLLCGLVVNNAIVLIDYINRLRRDGMDRHAAIVKGGSDRLRPILMTTMTTILGLLPMIMPLLLPALATFVDTFFPAVAAKGYHHLLQWLDQVLPSVFGPLEGRERSYAPMCLALVSGLTTSTILTLIVMPTMYSLIDDVGAWVRRLFVGSRVQTSP